MESQSLSYSLFNPDFNENIILQNNYIAWSIILCYIAFTKVIGPSIMKSREPMELKWLLLLYNSILVAGNIYLSIQITGILIHAWPYRCDIKNSPIYKNQQAFYGTGWGLLCIKFAELLDTVFFILRKKFNQVSFLHVFHHTVVCVLYRICLRHTLFSFYLVLIGSINCSIHVLLYLYYALSALGPGVRKYLWWKKYLTTLQIMQFLVLMLYMIFSFLVGCEEFGNYDRAVLAGLIIITVLFLNFYYQTYSKEKVK